MVEGDDENNVPQINQRTSAGGTGRQVTMEIVPREDHARLILFV